MICSYTRLDKCEEAVSQNSKEPLKSVIPMIAKMTKKSPTIRRSFAIAGTATIRAWIEMRRPSFLESTLRGRNSLPILRILSVYRSMESLGKLCDSMAIKTTKKSSTFQNLRM